MTGHFKNIHLAVQQRRIKEMVRPRGQPAGNHMAGRMQMNENGGRQAAFCKMIAIDTL